MEPPVVLTLPVCLTSWFRRPTRKIQFPLLFGSTYPARSTSPRTFALQRHSVRQ